MRRIEILCDVCGALITRSTGHLQRHTPNHVLQDACSEACAEELLRRDEAERLKKEGPTT